MKLAYFSPMPPARTGIATYSAELVKHLNRACDLTVFSGTPNPAPMGGIEIIDFASNPVALKLLDRYDHLLYHVGNNPGYHLDIWKALTLFPGSVCLHDVVIYYLAAGLGRAGLLKELLLADPENAFRNLQMIEAQCPDGNLLRYPAPSRFPSVKGLLESTSHVIVHNETSAQAVRELGFAGRVDVVPLLHYAAEYPPPPDEELQALRRNLGFADSDIVFGAFGFIGPTKRLHKVFEAFARMKAMGWAKRARLLIVGEGESLDEGIRDLGLQDVVTRTGFVADDQFRRYLAAIDVLLNLRYPSHGESSATLVQAMSYGKPCLVTDQGSFSEFPPDTVLKIGFGETEVDDIVRAAAELMTVPETNRRIGVAARDHIARAHAPEVVAAQFLQALRTQPSRRQAAREALPSASAEFRPSAYMEERARELQP